MLKLLPALALMMEIIYLVSEAVCGQCVIQIGYREKLLSNSGDYIKYHQRYYQKESAFVYLDDLRVKIVRRIEKQTEFRDGRYSNGYRDNNGYLEKPKACYCCCKRDKKRDRFLDSQEQHQRRLEKILYSLTKLVSYLILEVGD